MYPDLTVGTLTEVPSGRHWTVPEIHQEIARRVQRYGQLGLARGDRVLIHFGNQLEIFVEILAIWRLGGCVIPVDARLTVYETENLAKAARARFSVVNSDPESSALAEGCGTDIVHTGSDGDAATSGPGDRGDSRLDDDALILFTSGTTGDPKGVVHTHRSLRARWITLQKSLGLNAYRKTLCMLPTHFGHGLICNCLFPWLAGCDLVIAPPFKPEMLMHLGKLVDEHEITFMSSVPSMWNLTLRLAQPPSKRTLARVHIGSAPLSADLWSQVQGWAGTLDVVNAYGITETGSWVAGASAKTLKPVNGLVGAPWERHAASPRGAQCRRIHARDPRVW